MLVSAAASIFTCPSLRAVLHGAIDVAARPIVVQHSVRILEHSSVWVTDVLHPRGRKHAWNSISIVAVACCCFPQKGVFRKSTDAVVHLAIVLKVPVGKPSRVARLSGGGGTAVGRVGHKADEHVRSAADNRRHAVRRRLALL